MNNVIKIDQIIEDKEAQKNKIEAVFDNSPMRPEEDYESSHQTRARSASFSRLVGTNLRNKRTSTHIRCRTALSDFSKTNGELMPLARKAIMYAALSQNTL